MRDYSLLWTQVLKGNSGKMRNYSLLWTQVLKGNSSKMRDYSLLLTQVLKGNFGSALSSILSSYKLSWMGTSCELFLFTFILVI